MKKIIAMIWTIGFCFNSTVLAQFDDFCAQYDILSTIAGKGQIDDKGVNGWLAEYEGGNALAAELSRPHFAMADSAGNIFIADKDAHAIRKVTPDGIITTVAGTSVAGDNGDSGPGTATQLNAPNGLWVNPDGAVFILDLGNSKIRKLEPTGNLTTVFTDPGGISIGRGLWVSADGSTIFYSSGSRVKKWTAGEGVTVYASGFSQLGNLVFDPSGQLVVTDRGANMVYRVWDDGTKEIIAGNGTAYGGGDGAKAPESGIEGVRGVWFVDDGAYLLATHEDSRIWYVDTTGVIHLFLNGISDDDAHTGDGEHFQTPGYKISEVRAVCLDCDGNIIITENDVGYIRKIRRKTTSVVNSKIRKPENFRAAAYPNPFNSATKIEYQLAQTGQVILTIHNALGQKISTLINQLQNQGRHKIIWTAADNFGQPVPTGIYFYRIQTANFNYVGKILYLK